MTTRTWNEGDPWPTGCDAVVDDEGITWLRVEDPWDEGYDGHYGWVRQRYERYPAVNGSLPVVAGGQVEDDWSELLATYGPLREATDEEARHLTVVLASPAQKEG